MEASTDATEYHFWMPVPQDRRHAFKGARRWNGQRRDTTVCGSEVALAAPSEMDWIHVRTCPHCWDLLVTEQTEEHGHEVPDKCPGCGLRYGCVCEKKQPPPQRTG